jgi:replicative DNA helicase
MKEWVHYSKQFEAAVLGACMLEQTAFGRIYGLINPETFYLIDNQEVFRVIDSLYQENLPIDMLTVTQRMIEKNIQLHAGDIPWYITFLTLNVVSTAHLESHALALKKMWRRRELEKITHSVIDPGEDERKQAIAIQNQIQEILGEQIKRDWYSMDQLMYELMLHQEQIKQGKKEFITTGFKGVDDLNGGFSPGQLIILGARPSVGKSALMGLMAGQIARKKKTVGIISLEMNNIEIAARLASLETETSFAVIHRNLFLDSSQHEIFYDRLRIHALHLPIYVSDKTKVDVNEIRSKAAKLKHAHGLDFLIVDYLQLVESSGSNKNYNREQEVAKISRGLKLLAMEMQIPVMVLCQLNRAVTNRNYKDRFPKLSDLRESGAIEQDADVVMMLHRDWMADFQEDEQGNSTENTADLLGLKWRNGALFHKELDFNPQLMKFSEKGQNLIPVQLVEQSQINYF